MHEPLVVRFTTRRLLTFTLLGALLGGPSGHALAQSFQDEPIWRAPGTGASANAAVGDLDLDGDLDLVVADYTPGPAIYWNVGGSEPLTRTPTRLEPPASGVFCAAVGDLDGDGDPDLVFGTETGRNVIYWNEAGTFGSPVEFGLTGSSWDVDCADVDKDGDLDLVFGNLDAANRLYRNDGGVLGNGVLEFDPDTVTRGVAVGELNGDPAALEILSGNDSRPNRVFTLDPVRGLELWAEFAPDSRTMAVELADFAGNGVLDIVATNEDKTVTLHSGDAFSETFTVGPLTGPARYLVVGDVNRDGRPDFIVGDEFEGAVLYLWGIPLERQVLGVPDAVGFPFCLADLEADGDLDLIVGHAGDGNAGAVFALKNLTPWLSPSGDALGTDKDNRDGATADLDLDGDPDLVIGGDDGWEVHLNTGDGSFETSTGGTERVRGIAIQDLDGDGDPDLVLANEQESNTVYRNDLLEGVPNFVSVWSSPAANRSSSVAIDTSGVMPTLVFGNGSSVTPERNTEFRASGDDLTFMPSPWNPPSNLTHQVAFADLDMDGDADLVGGNGFEFGIGAFNTLYERSTAAGVDSLHSTPVLWGGEQPTLDLAIGDLDGDGLLDIATGNSEQSSWIGNPGTLAGFATAEPNVIGGVGSQTLSLVLGDVDGDGDLDVVRGVDQIDRLHANDDARFTEVWKSTEDRDTRAVLFEDLDRDGDLDLVAVGERHDRIYLGRRHPAYRFDPLSPVGQLPNNGPLLQAVTLVRDEGTNTARVGLTVVDPESDPLWVVPEYQYAGDPTWYRASVTGGTDRVGPLTTDPEGVRHEFEWNLLPLAFDPRDVVLRLRSVSIPAGVSQVQHVASYQHILGTPIQPLRGEVSPGASRVTFEPVTWGDTVRQSFEVLNTGNLPLQLQRVDGPPVLMAEEFDATSLPATLQPGASLTLELSVSPVASAPSGTSFLTVASDDPLSPEITVDIDLEVYPLTVTTRVLSASPEVPLGTDLSVLVTPVAPAAEIERVELRYRATGSDLAFSRLLLERSSEDVHDYLGVIARSDVTEAGLDYYAEVVNGNVIVTDPPDAPDSAVHHVATQSPLSVEGWVSEPSDGHFAGDSIGVAALLPEGSVFVRGSLFHREPGQTAFEEVPLVPLDPPSEINGLEAVALGMIPATGVGVRGVQYRLTVETLRGTEPLQDPAGDSGDPATHTIAVQVLDMQDPRGDRPGGVYDEVSIPLLPSVSVTESLTDDLGPLDVAGWRFFQVASGTAEYEELTASNQEGVAFEPGRAYWLVHRDPATIGSGRGFSTPTSDLGRSLRLEPGLNLVGNPFAFPVAWNDITIGLVPWSTAVDSLIETPRTWAPSTNDYVGAGALMEPWEGYWIRNLGEQPALLIVPPVETEPSPTAAIVTETKNRRIRIAASRDDQSGSAATARLIPSASATWDGQDLSALPLPPGDGLQVYFPRSSWDRHPGRYSVDSRNADSERTEWAFDVAMATREPRRVREITVFLGGLETIPESVPVFLVDGELNRVVDVRASATYSFFSGDRAYRKEKDARFTLIVGADESEVSPGAPQVTRLLQSYPNPFRGTTAIRYELAEPGPVRLEIYDVQGRLVWGTDREHTAPGRFEVPWDGTSRMGRVAPGLYFYRLITPTLVETRKLHRIG